MTPDRDQSAFDQQLWKAKSAKEYFHLLQTLAPLNRACGNGFEAMQAARAAIQDDRKLINARDLACELRRFAELMTTETRDGMDYTMAEQAEIQAKVGIDMAQSGHRLNLVTTLFFCSPPSLRFSACSWPTACRKINRNSFGS